MRLFFKIIIGLLIGIFILSLILAVIIPAGLFFLVMTLWTRLKNAYIRRFRPDIIAREQAKMNDMDIPSNLAMMAHEMMNSGRSWEVSDFEAASNQVIAPNHVDDDISRGEEKGYRVMEGGVRVLTSDGKKIAKDFSVPWEDKKV